MGATTTVDLSALTDDGDTLMLPTGNTLRLRVEPDPDMSLMDEQGEGVWCGRLEWTQSHDYGTRRPDDFTGRAEVIERDGRSALWWEVPADIEIGSDTHRSLRTSILDLLRFGYVLVGLEELATCDHGAQHVIRQAWIGGVDSFYPELLGELFGDLS